MAYPPEHYAGLRLFNEGEFWHAHEQWERCWLAASEPDRSFYKGLIQTAAALVHAQRGNRRGLLRNWAKARPKIVALLPRHRGLALATLLVEMDAYVLANDPAAHPPKLAFAPPPTPDDNALFI
jgi:hypothetical protein